VVLSTTKTGRHDIAEILLKVALNTKNQNQINPCNGITQQPLNHSIPFKVGAVVVVIVW